MENGDHGKRTARKRMKANTASIHDVSPYVHPAAVP